MLYILVALVALTQSASLLNKHDMVSTPLGYRPRQCLHQVEEKNHIIRHMDDGTYVEYPDSQRTVFHPTLPECTANAKIIEAQLAAKKKAAEKQKTDGLGNLGDGWQIYGGWYPPSEMGNFSVSYTVPNEEMADDGQIMYYFIGMQNNDNRGNVTIIQPVITYCQSGCANTQSGSTTVGWSGNSWNCCPNGQTWFSNPVPLTANAKSVDGFCYSNSVTGMVGVITSYGGVTSTLNLDQDFRDYDWVDVTLEAYDYGSKCDAFNSQPFMFNNMVLTEADGSNLESPVWNIVNTQLCKGSISFSNGGLTASIIGTTE